MEFILESTSFTVYFKKVNEIRRKAFEFEDVFSPFFVTPFQINQVPDTAQEDIPRIIANSRKGFSNLFISQVHSQYNANFNYTKNTKWEDIYEHLKDIIYVLYTGLEKLKINNFHYAGLMTQLFLPTDNDKEAILFLMERFSQQRSVFPYDYNAKFTFIEESKYFINYTISNIRKYSGSKELPRLVPAYLKMDATGIMITIDINDRFAYNTEREYFSDSMEGLNILAMNHAIITDRLARYLEKGEFFSD